jgi:hypothetical protein
MISPCVLPSVVICFHVFTDSFLGFYIACIALYHVHQSDNRFGSILPHFSARLLSPFLLSSIRLRRLRLDEQTPRLAVILLENPLGLASSLRLARVQKPNDFRGQAPISA